MPLTIGVLAAGILFFSATVFAGNGSEYRARYPLRDATTKLVDNHGDGFTPLYGVRNFRAVLNGIYYRGGANNYYHKSNKRPNMNPLPDDGLQNLCEEGFSTAVYLYATNYNSAPKTVNCQMADGSDNQLSYKQLSILSASGSQLHEVLALISSHLQDDRKGPVYLHCWNGWHASGVMAAYVLRQFCDFTAEEAVAYWDLNTDGHNDSSYDGMRTKIRGFHPFADLALTPAERAKVCPDARGLRF